jgi:hypothetical protein
LKALRSGEMDEATTVSERAGQVSTKDDWFVD